jgi:hypothetical protein
MISNRNVDSNEEYVLLQRNAVASARAKQNDALERATDAVTEKYNGEYLMNAKIYVLRNGKRIKVEGDVWGLKARTVDVDVEASVTKKIELNTGDFVTFRHAGKLIEGKIIGINTREAIVEYENMYGATKRKEVPFDLLTKIEK